MCGKLNHYGRLSASHLGLSKSPAKSSAVDSMRNHKADFFEVLYYTLTAICASFLLDSQTYGLTIKALFIADSTTINIFNDILKGIGRNPKNDGKKKKDKNYICLQMQANTWLRL